MRLKGKSTHPEVKAENALISAPALPSILSPENGLSVQRGGCGAGNGEGQRSTQI